MIKSIRNIAGVLCAALLVAGTAFAADKFIPGPKGGKILTKTAPHAEFFVTKDHKVVVTFYDAELKPVAAKEQSVVVIAEAKDGKKKIEFETADGALVSKQPLPAGDKYQVVVQLKEKAAAKPVNYRVAFNESPCGECKRPEYACTCDESGEGEHK